MKIIHFYLTQILFKNMPAGMIYLFYFYMQTSLVKLSKNTFRNELK